MTRLWGRAARGERISEATPDGRWQVLTTLGTLSLRGIEAAMTVAEATDGDVFRAYVEQLLCARLQQGDVVVMDNLSAHKVAGITVEVGTPSSLAAPLNVPASAAATNITTSLAYLSNQNCLSRRRAEGLHLSMGLELSAEGFADHIAADN
jgi:hypothetical protein